MTLIRALFASTLLAASAGAAAAVLAAPSDALVSSAPWWEKLVVTVGGGGDTDCIYQSSLAPGSNQACDVQGDALAEAAGDDSGSATSITFERRFTPGPSPDVTPVHAGDTIWYATEIVAARMSNSRPGWGLVTAANTGRNQRGEPVISFVSSVLVACRSGGRPPS